MQGTSARTLARAIDTRVGLRGRPRALNSSFPRILDGYFGTIAKDATDANHVFRISNDLSTWSDVSPALPARVLPVELAVSGTPAGRVATVANTGHWSTNGLRTGGLPSWQVCDVGGSCSAVVTP